MEKPFLTLSSKDFQTGIAPSAHSQNQGLFYKADGITAINDPGVDQSANNGLLMCGAVGTTIGGTLTGSIVGATRDLNSSSKAYFSTDDGKLWSLTLDTTFSTSLASLRSVSGLVSGLEIFKTSGGRYLYYWQQGQIGRFDLSSTYSDAWSSCTTEYIHATHKFNNIIYYGNGLGQLGTITDIAGTPTNTTVALQLPQTLSVTDISDDGTYVVIAATDNQLCDTSALADTRILFWNGATTTLWDREFSINDPFIFAVEKTPFGIFAFGVTGIWQVSFAGIKKVYSRSPGIYAVTHANAILYGRRAASFYINALMWGGGSGSNKVVKTWGQLDLGMKAATIYPFLSTASKNITYLDGQMLKGYVLVGDDTPQLKAYPFSNANAPQTGLTAQTVYFKVPAKVQVQRVDVIFGVPLASGDSVSVSLSTDETNSPISYGSATFASDGATRRKQLIPATKRAVCEDQLSLTLTYNAGAVKIKAVEFYAQTETP